MGAPVKTDKHELTWSNLGQNAVAGITVNLSTAVVPANKNSANEVEIGAHIYGIYLEFHFSAETITNPKVIHWQVRIVRADQTLPTAINYNQDTRAQIIKRGMEMLPKDVATVFKRIVFVRIPKVYQRQKALSLIDFQYSASSTETINACGFAIYKEFY